jgi:uncharacterized damage-inducible protein DinB
MVIMTLGGYDMNETTLRTPLLEALELAHQSEGWIQPMVPVLKEIDAKQAAWRPTPGAKSIWDITAHLTQYTETLAADLAGRKGPVIDDWPTIEDTGEPAWEALRERFYAAAAELPGLLADMTDEQLSQPPAGKETALYERVLSIAIHDAYHAGQIYQLAGLHALMGARETVGSA